MTKEIILKHQSDPGHGWVGIKAKFIKELDIQNKISPYSYIKGKSVYLEEDSDLSILCDALKSKGYTFKFQQSSTNNNHPIRYYDGYTLERFYATFEKT